MSTENMPSGGRRPRRRRRRSGISLAGLLVISPLVRAAEGPAPEPTPEAVLARFEREYRPAEGYMRPLGDEGWVTRFRALRDLVRLGERAFPALSGELVPLEGTETLHRRVLAAEALSLTADSGVEDVLVRSLQKDASPAVRLYAADALGVLRTPTSMAALRAARDADPNGDVRAHAGFALEREGRESWLDARKRLLDFDDRRLDTARLGERAPTFRLPNHQGIPVDLAAFRGKRAVILIFIYGDT